MASGRCDVRHAIARSSPLPRLDGGAALSRTVGPGVRLLARRREMAPQVLPDVRIRARDGSARRRRPGPAAISVLRRLRDTLALPPDPVPVLRERRAAAFGPGDRRRGWPAPRSLRGLQGISQDV